MCERDWNYTDFDYYQDRTDEFAIYGENIFYPFLGLAEEAGEVCGKVAKHIRDTDPGELIDRDMMAKELGDVLWMVAQCAKVLDLSLADIAKGNIEKLQSRKDRNVLKGSGDER